MATVSGVAVIGDYATPGTNAAKVAALLALIPNPDASNAGGSGTTAGGTSNSYLDEMSPAAAVQIRAELASLAANVDEVA